MMMGNNAAMMMGMNSQPNMNMMMMDQGGMNQGMFMAGGNMNNMNNMGTEDMSGGGGYRVRDTGRRIAAGRGRPVRGSPAGRVRPSPKGNVKNRLGFKSNITVDHTLLNEGTMNEED